MTPRPRLCDFFNSKTNLLGEDANKEAGTRIVSLPIESRIIDAGGAGYSIQGKILKSTGQKIFEVGEVVPVLFKNNEPVVILGHTWRKAQFEERPDEAVFPGEYQNVDHQVFPSQAVSLVSTSQGDFGLNLEPFIPEPPEGGPTLRRVVFCANNPTLIAVMWRSFVSSPTAGISEGGFADPDPARDEFLDTLWHFRIFKVSSSKKTGKIIKADLVDGEQPKIQIGSQLVPQIKQDLVASLDIKQAEITTRRVTLRTKWRHNSNFFTLDLVLTNGLGGFCRSDGTSTFVVNHTDDTRTDEETFEDSVPYSPAFSTDDLFWCLEENGEPKIYTICTGDSPRRLNNLNKTYPWWPPDGAISWLPNTHASDGSYGPRQIANQAGAGDLPVTIAYRRESRFGDSPGLSFGVMDSGIPVRDVVQYAFGGNVSGSGEPAVYLINLTQAKAATFDAEGVVFRNTTETFLVEWEWWLNMSLQGKIEASGDPVNNFGNIISTPVVPVTAEPDQVTTGIRFTNSESPYTIDPWKIEHEASQGVNEITGQGITDINHQINLFGANGQCAIRTDLFTGVRGQFQDVPFGSFSTLFGDPIPPELTQTARLSLVQLPSTEFFLGGTGPGTLIRPIFELRPNQLEGSLNRGKEFQLVEWDGGDLTELGLETTSGQPDAPILLMVVQRVNKSFVILSHVNKPPAGGITIFRRGPNSENILSAASQARFEISAALTEMGFTNRRLVFVGDQVTSPPINLSDFGLLKVRPSEDEPGAVDFSRTSELILPDQPSNQFRLQRGDTSAIFPQEVENQ